VVVCVRLRNHGTSYRALACIDSRSRHGRRQRPLLY
jgi:hypothetical protein